MRGLGGAGLLGAVLLAAAVAQDAPPAANAAPAKGDSASAAAPAKGDSAEVAALMASVQRSLMSEEWAQVAALCRQVLEKAPDQDEARFGLGTALGHLGQYQAALGLLDALPKTNPDNSALKNNLAWIYAKAKDPKFQNFEKAVKLARAAVLASPADYNIWNTLAEAYYGLKDYERALRSARHALRLSELAGVPDEEPYRELYERCQDAADSEEQAP